MITPGNPLAGLFKNLPPGNVPFREAMNQLLSAPQTMPLTMVPATMDVESLSLCADVAMDCANEDMYSNPAAAGLTVDEIAVIKMYTMPSEPPTTALYYLLNKALREKNRDKLKPFVKLLWLLMQALRKAQPCSRPVVYRGVKKDLSSQYREKGQVITWQGFTSTTTALDVLSQDMFLGTNGSRTMFHIELTTGRARMISDLSMVEGENEVLLPPNSRFEVESILGPTADGQLTVQLKEIEPKDPILRF
eukprot:gene12185-biopygen5950